MQTIEFAVLDWIARVFRCGFLDAVMPVFTRLSDHGELWIALAAVLLLIPKTRRLGVYVSAALVLDLCVCNLFLKPLIARVRPCDINTAVTLLVVHPSDYSFPSGHTAVSFAAIGALFAANSRLWIPSCVIGALLAFSRLYLYVHWPTDILGGLVVGLACGFAGYHLVRLIEKALKKRKTQ